ncbi:MAG: phospholipid/glycerol acyltransferase [Myxococcaceae bacterium]|nr:phospholipid/glycerol acyltransferase [Myxococcaceae bacterium]
MRLVRRYLAPVVDACHRPTLEGVEHLPPAGPFLLVANHSAGLGVAEIMAILVLYLRHVGEARPLAAFTHPIGYRVFPLSLALRHLGAVPSTYAAAAAALSAGVPLLVFPGGDHETLRPIWQHDRVDFGGRVGFLRIAREAGVPVVPLGIRGGHLTAPILFRSRALATLLVAPRLIGQKRWGVSLLGLLVGAAILAAGPASWWLRGALVGLFLGSPLSFLPWIPWTLRLRIGPPLAPAELFPAREGTDDELRRALVRVQAAVQSLVDR